jgi:hypothetical protein
VWADITAETFDAMALLNGTNSSVSSLPRNIEERRREVRVDFNIAMPGSAWPWHAILLQSLTSLKRASQRVGIRPE